MGAQGIGLESGPTLHLANHSVGRADESWTLRYTSKRKDRTVQQEQVHTTTLCYTLYIF